MIGGKMEVKITPQLKYSRTPKGKIVKQIANKKYNQSEKGKLAHKKAVQKWRQLHAKKYDAYNKVYCALKCGRIKKPTICPECRKEVPVQAHHEDYNKPLEISWLCESCHKQEHKFIKGKYND